MTRKIVHVSIMHITFLFYNGMTALDAIGPYEVLSRLPGATVAYAALEAGVITSCKGLQFIADQSLANINQTDILLIPGGGTAPALREFPEILSWVQKMHKTTTWTTSVCTGSLILGAAGLLTGKKATTHWAVMDRLKTYGAEPVQQRIVQDGKIITAAGVSAGIDMALMLAAKLHGDEVAQALQLGIEYDPEPPFNTGSPAKAPAELVASLRSVLLERFEP